MRQCAGARHSVMATSAPGLRLISAHICAGTEAHPSHICTGTGAHPSHAPHMRQEWAHPCHISAGTGRTLAACSAPRTRWRGARPPHAVLAIAIRAGLHARRTARCASPRLCRFSTCRMRGAPIWLSWRRSCARTCRQHATDNMQQTTRNRRRATGNAQRATASTHHRQRPMESEQLRA